MDYTGTLKVTTPSDLEIRIVRVFDAPRELVFEAYTRPELLRRWMSGPPGWEMTTCVVATTVGDTSRYAWEGPDGARLAMSGVLVEIVPPERIVATERFEEEWYCGESLCTIEFAEQDGNTTITQTLRYGSQQARDMALKSGMEQGMAMGYNKLAELLASSEFAESGK